MTSKLKTSVCILVGYVMVLFCQISNAQTNDTTRAPHKPLSGKNKEHIEVEKHEFHEQIETRVLFNGGQNTPNKIGKEHLDFIISGLKKDIAKYKHLYPQDKIVLSLKIKGYSDAKPFYPNQSPEERQTLNDYLAKKRTYYISNSVKKGLYPLVHGIEQALVIKGEELPPYYTSDEPEDPQRRMCIVTVLAYSVPVDSFASRKPAIIAIDHHKKFVPTLVEPKHQYLALHLPQKTTTKYHAGGKLTASNPTITNPVLPNNSNNKNKVVTPKATKPTPKTSAGAIAVVKGGNVVYANTNASVQFHTGWHTPKPQDYQYLQQLIKEIKEKVAIYRRNNDNKPMVIQLDVRGYADKQGFYYNQPIAQRQAQNKRLSEWRARTIGQFLQKYLKSQSIKVALSTQGLGETLPPGVTDGAVNDPLRRTCRASIQVVEGQAVNTR
ncbi:OmpA family protein [Microscilla marina]|nr:OmpA family protein [Microscilla marina]